MTITTNKFDSLLRRQQRSWHISLTKILTLLGVILVSYGTVGLFDGQRLSEGVPDLIGMVGEMLPPDFSRTPDWIKPLIDTIAM
ncbi:MAG: phosphonate ABC transporter, permease protein PhnE, partial [Trichodesmium sp. St17_bin3_1_1]|nr:phosphonate ABC transporter, permease protein PhnE [Trichodesmium sp. St17_bin3_1_1]